MIRVLKIHYEAEEQPEADSKFKKLPKVENPGIQKLNNENI